MKLTTLQIRDTSLLNKSVETRRKPKVLLPSHLDLIVMVDKIFQAFSQKIELDLLSTKSREIEKNHETEAGALIPL